MSDPVRFLQSTLFKIENDNLAKWIDVSYLTPEGKDFSIIDINKAPSQLKHVDGIAIASDNYDAYALAIELLDENEQFTVQYYQLFGKGSPRKITRPASPRTKNIQLQTSITNRMKRLGNK